MHDRALAVEAVAVAFALVWGIPLGLGIALGGKMTFTIYDVWATLILCSTFGLIIARRLMDLEKKIGSA